MKTYNAYFLMALMTAIAFVSHANEPLNSGETRGNSGDISSPPQRQMAVVFINKWKSGEYIGETSGRAMSMTVYKTTGNTKILWMVEDDGSGFVRLKNVGNGKYLHCENGKLQIGEIEQGWQSAQWVLEKKDGYVRIQNRFNKQYINNQKDILDISNTKKGWDSAWWKMQTI